MTSTKARKIDLDSLVLKTGAHDSPSTGLCVMEAVAYFRGLPHTDHPPCVSPSIGAFLRSWNDSLPEGDRQQLKPYILKVVGTNIGPEAEEKRAWMAVDWLTRTFTPAWLELAGLKDHAEALRALPELSTTETAERAQETIESARSAAWDVAWDVARDVARDAARDVAWDVAWAVAWAVARDVARAAAGDAAWAAAWAAAGAAAWAALQPTVVALQASAFDLLDRMIAIGKAEARS